ncbi:DUF4282 domain-containing protein [Metabacillus dongyingensis]|uniref:DUF4282 domain-containing protein n=1 Tax=Metabacillus dongyingensis TaxID=2874282 RepID=UPI003B8D1390
MSGLRFYCLHSIFLQFLFQQLIFSDPIVIYGGGAQIFAGLFMILLGPFVIRIYCELLIVMFKMNEALQDIKKNVSLKGKGSVSSSETL